MKKEELEKRVKELEVTIVNMDKIIQDKNKENQNLHDKNEQIIAQILAKSETIRTLKNEIKKILREKDSDFEDCRIQYELLALEKKLKDKERTIDTLKNNLDERVRTIAEIRSNLVKANSMIEKLRDRPACKVTFDILRHLLKDGSVKEIEFYNENDILLLGITEDGYACMPIEIKARINEQVITEIFDLGEVLRLRVDTTRNPAPAE